MLFVWDGVTKYAPLEAYILSYCDASIGESAGGMVDVIRLAFLIDDDTESSGVGSKMGDVSWCIFVDDNWARWVEPDASDGRSIMEEMTIGEVEFEFRHHSHQKRAVYLELVNR